MVLLSIALAGCGGATTPAAPPAAPIAAPPAAPAVPPLAVAPAVLELGEMTVFGRDAAVYRIHANGQTEIFSGHIWVFGPTIKADGTFEGHGHLLARVHGDGTITDQTGHPREVKVQDDFLAYTNTTIHGEGIRLGADGMLILEPSGKQTPWVRAEGADTPGKRRTVLALCGVLVFGPPPTEPFDTPVAPAAAAPQVAVEPAVLELGEMRMLHGGDPALRIHASGRTEIFSRQVWVAGPTIKPDGSIEGHGHLLARVQHDGTITDQTGQPMPLKVTHDSLVFTHGAKAEGIRLAADGLMIPSPEGEGPWYRVEGADTPGKRRTALAVFAVLYFGPPPRESFDRPAAATAPVK